MSKPNKAGVEASDAKIHFSKILERVENGEEVTITRRGVPVARMIPIHRESSRAQRRAAIEALRKLAKGISLRGLRIRDLKSEGRH